jgi:predicted ribosome quality control (RQC) complex YloA/Tae2 family protein
MRKEMSSLDLLFATKELKILEGGKIEKIYQDGKTLRVFVYVSEKGTFELYFEPGKIFLTQYKRVSPEYPPSFCMFLRKHLLGQRILRVEQKNFERILEIETNDYILIFELFSRGNVILCDKSYNILMPLEVQLWKDREILPKKPYKYPPPLVNPFALKEEEFFSLLTKSERSIVAFLAMNLSLGGIYAEEVCLRAKIDKMKKCKEVSEEEARQIFQTMSSLLNQFKPQIIIEDSRKIDFAPFDMQIYADKQKVYYQSFNEALDEFFTEKEIVSEEEKKSQEDEEIEKLKRIRERQKETLKKFEELEKEARKKAELLFNNFDLLQRIFEGLQRARAMGLSWEEIKQRVEEEDTPEAQAIKEIREKEGKLILRLDKLDIEVDFRISPIENAELYYTEAKLYKKKIESVKEKIDETNKLIREAKKGGKKKEEVKKKPVKKRRRGKWYEKFRWSITSEGFLVIAGKDATQNEVIFKKYMSEEDIVLHADIHGAPLTVVKAEGREITPLAVREAAEIAAAYSKAWKMKLVAIDVYWVRPEQVSKNAPPGQYLPKGAFMIYGQKNYLRKIDLKLAIGVQIDEEKKEARVIAGSVQALSKHAKYFVTVFPGDLSQNETAKQVKLKILQKALPEDKPYIEAIPLEEFQKLLPPGESSVVG